jgi:hypothetical protein
MSHIVSGYDLDEDIRQHRFENLARAFRKGQVAELKQSTLNLLADYLEGKLKRPKGRPNIDEYDLALSLYSEYSTLRRYGLTRKEYAEYCITNHGKRGNELLDPLKGKGLSREDAINKLADIDFTGTPMGIKNVERLVTLGKRIDEYEAERFSFLEEELY